MNCEATQVLLHGLIDGELDAGHAREVEVHAAACPRCGASLRGYRRMRGAIRTQALRYAAPEHLRRRVLATLPRPVVPAQRASAPSRFNISMLRGFNISVLKGFGMGSFVSAAMAACLLLFITNSNEEQRLVGDAVSAHLRSLHGQLIDVKSTDQHTVKPWFNGRIEFSPPVIDLKAQGFTLVGGRLDYIDGRPVAAIVYERGGHVINLFVSQAQVAAQTGTVEKLEGFNVWRWSWSDLGFSAVSDLNAEEFNEFCEKLEAAVRSEWS
jgi:anti-sigma factor RsiW